MNFSRNIFDRMRFADQLFVIDGIRRSLSMLCRLLPLVLVFAVTRAVAHNNSGYYYVDGLSSGQAGFDPDWMGDLEDSVKVSNLSVPGTRETMAKYGGDAVECQSMTLSQQLASGIRALDSSVKLDAFPHDGMKIWCRV